MDFGTITLNKKQQRARTAKHDYTPLSYVCFISVSVVICLLFLKRLDLAIWGSAAFGRGNIMSFSVIYGLIFGAGLATAFIMYYLLECRFSIVRLLLYSVLPEMIIIIVALCRAYSGFLLAVAIAFGIAFVFDTGGYAAPAKRKKKTRRRVRLYMLEIAVCAFIVAILLVIGRDDISAVQVYDRVFSTNIAVSTGNYLPEDDYLALLRSFDEQGWCDMTSAEKLAVLREVVDFETVSVMGCPAAPQLREEDFGGDRIGDYNGAFDSIRIDSGHLEQDCFLDVLATALHESRHYYQVCMVDAYDKLLTVAPDYKELEIFSYPGIIADNNRNYISSKDLSLEYYNQPIEIDARDYEIERLNGFYLPQLDFDDETGEKR